ncbi:MAG: helix-turn-helix domain-containing protein [Oscillospiraceae bacterium]
MEPKTFGPFLREARKRRDMTQSQLAEKLHVSTAAVSKWEREKCLPDIAKLDELAQALDLSVLEIIKCEMQERELPKQELTEVYVETLSAAHKQNSREKKRIVFSMVCVFAVLLLAALFPVKMRLKGGGSVVYQSPILLYRVTDWHQMLPHTEGGEELYKEGISVEIFGHEILSDTREVPAH